MSVSLPSVVPAQREAQRASQARQARLNARLPGHVVTQPQSLPGGVAQKAETSGDKFISIPVVPVKRDFLLVATPGFGDAKDKPVMDIVERVAAEHRVRADEIFGPHRHDYIMRARHAAIVAVYLAKPKWSLPRLGSFFERDHTTILSALRRAGVYYPRLPKKRAVQ